MEVNLRVQPDVLRAKAEELSAERTNVTNLMEQAKVEISSLSTSWKSEASEQFQNKFKQVYDDIDNLIAIMSEHINDITEIATIYSSAEKSAQSAGDSLPTDGVFRV